MLGKIRVAHAPWANHGWHVALQPRANGLETLPTAAGDGRTFTLVLDLCRHAIVLWVSDEIARRAAAQRRQRRGAAFAAGRDARPERACRRPSTGMPSEIEGAVPFAEDKAPRHYDRNSADRLREALAAMLPAFEHFRAGFSGKASPVHFWWGAFDLAVTRFSGRDRAAASGRRARPARPDHARSL